MRLIFWTFADGGSSGYLRYNKSLQELSQEYDFYFLCSGNRGNKLVRKHFRAQVLPCENNIQEKSQLLLKHFQMLSSFRGVQDDDVLVKIDLDAVLFDLPELVRRIKKNIKPESIMGNYREQFVTNDQGDREVSLSYVRGACQAMPISTVKKVSFECDDRYGISDFDIPFCEQVQNRGIKLIDCPLFEINNKYTYTHPVWHPDKKARRKVPQFSRHCHLYDEIKKNA